MRVPARTSFYHNLFYVLCFSITPPVGFPAFTVAFLFFHLNNVDSFSTSRRQCCWNIRRRRIKAVLSLSSRWRRSLLWIRLELSGRQNIGFAGTYLPLGRVWCRVLSFLHSVLSCPLYRHPMLAYWSAPPEQQGQDRKDDSCHFGSANVCCAKKV